MNSKLTSVLTLALLGACANAPSTPPSSPSTTTGSDVPASPKAADARKFAVDRAVFNETAYRLNLPLYWASDKNVDGAVDPDEVASLLFYPTDGKWTDHGKFTAEFEKAFGDIKSAIASPAPTDERLKLVREELAQGATTMVYSDLRGLGPEDKALVGHMLKVAKMIDELYATQTGAKALEGKVPRDDGASLAVFRRNWGPKCLAPKTENNAACSAVPGAPKPVCDAYPTELQQNPKFCGALENDAQAKKLLNPFVVVRNAKTSLVTQPFAVAYKDQVGAIAAELKTAAEELKDPNEAALKNYLFAASKSFATGEWLQADEAWAKMNATNSKWYVRVGADEVYWDPCAQKAGFHLAFARINKDSLTWQEKLTPVEAEMENALAGHIGAPYKARNVTFHLPDFIDVVFNAGDSRHPHGGTIGQSLPNWGKVAAEGRGRTVAMSNLYTDPDSLAMRKKQAESLLSKETMAFYSSSAQPGLLTTILHEATHNLGPAHEYTYKGQTDAKAFGGNLSAMLEELKAQTGGIYYVEFLRKKGIISDEVAKQTYTDAVVWAFGHISRGMYTEGGGRKAYSQLAAIHVGFLMDEGALTWDPNALAANGSDKGAFTIQWPKMVPAVDKLMKIVGGIKAKNDKAAAEELAAKYVDGKTVPQPTITERELRFPKPSFVYAYDI
jgi:hypothetical protein